MQIIFRSYSAWLVPAVLTLASFGSGASALAQTTYPFETTYDAEITNTLLEQTPTEVVLDTSVTGESADAPYGLTNVSIENYSRIDLATGVATYNSDPATFGLEGLPFGTFTLFGNGDDKLFGTNRGTASLESGSGTITITGGAGRFVGATGTLDLFQTITSNPDPTGINAPIISPATVSGSLQVVPEPIPNATVLGVSALGVGLLLHSRRNSRKRTV
jgi:hypothetical protein